MEASDIKKLKDLEEENRRLKQMFADLSLECWALKDVIEQYSMSIRHACQALSLCTYTYRFVMEIDQLMPYSLKHLRQGSQHSLVPVDNTTTLPENFSLLFR